MFGLWSSTRRIIERISFIWLNLTIVLYLDANDLPTNEKYNFWCKKKQRYGNKYKIARKKSPNIRSANMKNKTIAFRKIQFYRKSTNYKSVGWMWNYTYDIIIRWTINVSIQRSFTMSMRRFHSIQGRFFGRSE